jgi:hypothetical protein
MRNIFSFSKSELVKNKTLQTEKEEMCRGAIRGQKFAQILGSRK